MLRMKRTGTRRYLCNHTQRVSALSSGTASRTVSNRPTLNHSFVPCDAPPGCTPVPLSPPAYIAVNIARRCAQYAHRRSRIGSQKHDRGEISLFSRTIYDASLKTSRAVRDLFRRQYFHLPVFFHLGLKLRES